MGLFKDKRHRGDSLLDLLVSPATIGSPIPEETVDICLDLLQESNNNSHLRSNEMKI